VVDPLRPEDGAGPHPLKHSSTQTATLRLGECSNFTCIWILSCGISHLQTSSASFRRHDLQACPIIPHNHPREGKKQRSILRHVPSTQARKHAAAQQSPMSLDTANVPVPRLRFPFHAPFNHPHHRTPRFRQGEAGFHLLSLSEHRAPRSTLHAPRSPRSPRSSLPLSFISQK
jgi:hypothetical protein